MARRTRRMAKPVARLGGLGDAGVGGRGRRQLDHAGLQRGVQGAEGVDRDGHVFAGRRVGAVAAGVGEVVRDEEPDGGLDVVQQRHRLRGADERRRHATADHVSPRRSAAPRSAPARASSVTSPGFHDSTATGSAAPAAA